MSISDSKSQGSAGRLGSLVMLGFAISVWGLGLGLGLGLAMGSGWGYGYDLRFRFRV